MKKIAETAFIIQARTQSKRIPNKMVKNFSDSSLFEIAINKLLSSKIIPKENIYLSILDDELIAIANKYKLNIFKRSPDSVSERVPLQKLFEWYNKIDYKYYMMLSACCPLLTIKTIDDFINNFLNSSSRGQLSVLEKKHFMYDYESHKMINNYLGEEKYLRTLETKLLEPIYEAVGCLYAGTMSDFEKKIYLGTFKSKSDPKFYIMEEEETFDIDYPWQFEVGEILYKKYLCKLESNE